MASPLNKIRKNQKLILGVLGILLMIVFVFGDVAAWMGGPEAGSNEVVVTTNYGAIKRQELSVMFQNRAMINRFLGEALRAAYGDFYRSQDIFPHSERAVVQTMVLAKKGEELGMTVSDKIVNDYIKQLTADRVTTSELRNIMQNAKISQRKLFAALSEVILANQVAELSLRGIDAAPPAARWDYFQRLRRQVKAEVLPVPVEQFVSQIKNPGEDELTVFFEQYRDQYAIPGSPEPGFKVPRQGQFEFFRADYHTFYDAALATVTPEDVAKHYETFKDTRYLYRELPDFDPGAAAATPPATGAAAPPVNVEKSPPGTQPEQTTPPTSAPKSDSPATTSEPPATNSTPPNPETDTSNTPADSPAPSTAPDSSCGDEAQEAAAEPQQPAATAIPVEPPAVAATQTQPALTAPDSGSKAAPQAGASTDAAPTVTGDASKAATEATAPGGSTPASTLSPLVMPLSEEYSLPRDITAGPNPKYQPLWRVEEEIRKELARTRATEQIDGVLGKLRQTLEAAAFSWSQRRFSDEKSSVSNPAPQLDFEKLAAGTPGITAGKTPLASAQVIAETTELGKSQVNGQTPFAAAAFERLAIVKPTQSVDTDGNHYLFWKTVETEAKVPELAAVRKEVEHAWKMIKARDLAREKAQSLAAAARREPGKPLGESLGAQGKDAVETNSFNWLTLGSSPMMMGRPEPRLSEVQSVENAGNEFMRAVYSLDANEVGVAMNYPQTIAYVVRLVEGAPDALMKTQFMAAAAGNYQSFAFAAEIDAQPIVEAWRASVDKEAGVDWKQEPDQVAQR